MPRKKGLLCCETTRELEQRWLMGGSGLRGAWGMGRACLFHRWGKDRGFVGEEGKPMRKKDFKGFTMPPHVSVEKSRV